MEMFLKLKIFLILFFKPNSHIKEEDLHSDNKEHITQIEGSKTINKITIYNCGLYYLY